GAERHHWPAPAQLAPPSWPRLQGLPRRSAAAPARPRTVVRRRSVAAVRRRRTAVGRAFQARHPGGPERAALHPPALPLQLQVFAQATGLRTAHRDFGRFRVLHPQDVIPTEPRDDLLDLVDVHQVRTVYAPEDARIEPRLQLVERPIVRRPRVLA